jgi:hypothetical protein
MGDCATPAACAPGTVPIGERFFLAAILLYALLALALFARLVQVFAAPAQRLAAAPVAAAGWPAAAER